MDQKSLTSIIAVSAGVIAITIAGFQSIGKAEARRKVADLDARIQQLDQENEAARTTEKSLRDQLAQRTTEADERAKKLVVLQEQLDRLQNPPESGCLDSDQSRGADAIYVRGTARSGNTTVSDYCQLGRLVEAICIENPVGSGHFIRDSKTLTCPNGSRCVEGECLR